MGLFMGAVSGAGLVFGREFMDQSILDLSDAKQALELPILGAISRITTQEEIDKERGKKKKLITIGLISAFILVISALLISVLKR